MKLVLQIALGIIVAPVLGIFALVVLAILVKASTPETQYERREPSAAFCEQYPGACGEGYEVPR